MSETIQRTAFPSEVHQTWVFAGFKVCWVHIWASKFNLQFSHIPAVQMLPPLLFSG